MGLWTKGLKRSQTGELRLEEDIQVIIDRIQEFFNRYTNKFGVKRNGDEINMFNITENDEVYSMWSSRDILYIRFDGMGANVTVDLTNMKKQDVNLISSIRKEIEKWYRRCSSVYTPPEHVRQLYDLIGENLSRYDITRSLKDLYRI